MAKKLSHFSFCSHQHCSACLIGPLFSKGAVLPQCLSCSQCGGIILLSAGWALSLVVYQRCLAPGFGRGINVFNACSPNVINTFVIFLMNIQFPPLNHSNRSKLHSEEALTVKGFSKLYGTILGILLDCRHADGKPCCGLHEPDSRALCLRGM